MSRLYLRPIKAIHTREPEYPDPKRNVPERHEFLQRKISGATENEVDEMSRLYCGLLAERLAESD